MFAGNGNNARTCSGAGIQADIKTLTSLNVYATAVLTSITSQNTLGVDGIHDLPPEFVEKQLNAVLSDIGSDAVKTGMLSSAPIIETVAKVLRQYPESSRYLVVDPVMVSTSGSKLLADGAVQAFADHLIPITYLLTPNVPEAEVLLGLQQGSIKTLEDMYEAAKRIGAMGAQYVLVKGGHLPLERSGEKKVVDVLYESSTETVYEIENPFIATKDTHGTGCTLSSAIAGELAKGADGM